MNIEVLDPSTDYRKAFGDPSAKYTQAKSVQSTPRAVAIINGVRTPIVRYDIRGATHGASDVATVTLSLAGNPDWSDVLDATMGDGSVIAEIWAGFPKDTNTKTDTSQLTRRFLGVAQGYEADIYPGDQIEFRLQSLAALLTAEKRTTNIQGMTTADLVRGVAAQVGLKATVRLAQGQAPATMAQVCEQDQFVGVHNIRISDLLTACCQVDDATWRVVGDELRYLSNSTKGRPSRLLTYGVDPILSLSGSHYLYSRTIEVQVHAYQRATRVSHSTSVNTKKGGGYTQKQSTHVVTSDPVWGTNSKVTTATSVSSAGAVSATVTGSTGSGGAKSSGYTTFQAQSGIEKYKYYIYGTQAEANALAVLMWQQLSRFEYLLDCELSVTPSLLPALDIETLFQLNDCPINRFNTSTSAPYYFQREYHETFDVAQDTGDSDGWKYGFTALNHRLPPGEA